MAYFIFLKYLRNLEEFRKNPEVKIPPKSPYANLQSLGEFKNQILIQKNLSSALSARLPLLAHSAFGPAGPVGPSPPTGQSPAHLASQPLGPRVPLAYFAKDVFFIDSCLPFSAPSLYSLGDAWAPLVSSIFSTAPPAPHLGMSPIHYRLPVTPPLNPLQTEL
jgi:hypothetical protein